MKITTSFKATASLLAVATAVAAGTGAAVASSGPSAGSAATRTILVKDNFFGPRSVSVPKNTTLNFVWKGRLVHNVASGRKIILSNRKSGSGAIRVSRSVTLHCTLHPGMNLAVKVR